MFGRTAILPNYLLLAAADLAGKGLGFLAVVVTVRYLGVEGFGAVSFVGGFLAYALILGAGGTDVYAVRRAAASPGCLAPLAGTLMILRVALGLAVYAAMIALALAVPALRSHWELFAIYGLCVFTAAASLTWVSQSLRRTDVLALNTFGVQGLFLLALVGGFQLTREAWVVPAAQVAAEALGAAALLVWAWKVGGLGRPWPADRWRAVLTESAPIGGSRVLRTVSLTSDLILLGLLLPLEQVGLYAVAFKLFTLGLSVAGGYFIILFPRLAELANGPGERFATLLATSHRQLLALAVVPAGVLVVFPRYLLGLLFGAEFSPAADALVVLAVAVLVNLSLNFYRHALLARHQQRLELKLVGVSTGVHLAAKIALIPTLGILGAALGTLLGEVVLLLLARLAVGRALRDGSGVAKAAGFTPLPTPWAGVTSNHAPPGGLQGLGFNYPAGNQGGHFLGWGSDHRARSGHG